MKKQINIVDIPIDQNRTYIIAEAGSNHNGDYSMAKALIEAAAGAGADAIKFQTFKAENHYSKHTPQFSYLKEQSDGKSTYDLIKSIEIDREWHASLMNYAASCGISFFSSPCDVQAVDQLAELNVPAFKVASFDLVDLDLIRYMAKFGKTMILSTGMADYADIQKAIGACEQAANQQLVLLHCTSLYPAPVEISNLLAIQTMQKAFNYPVGYSDHTIGDHIPIAAVALGACMIEKHFTLNHELSGPDHRFAMEPNELAAMIKRIREVELARGDGLKKGPHDLEKEMYEKGRRSIHSRRALKAGDILKKDDICIKRPGYGISPADMEHIIGIRICKDIPEDYWITWEDLK